MHRTRTHPYHRIQEICVAIVLCCLLIPTTIAQNTFTEFRWYEGDLALRYPMDWQSPTSSVIDNNPTLQLVANNQADDPRPTPTITLTIYPDASANTDLYALLSQQLQTLDIIPAGPLPAQLLGISGIATNGVNADGTAYGSGRITLTDDGAIAIAGRGWRDERDEFVAIFDSIANSLLIGADNIIAPLEYGVLWHIDSYPDDGENAFIDIRGMAYRNNMLYIVDEYSGVFVIDAQTGIVTERIAFLEGIQPSSMAVDDAGTLYVGDIACGCIQRYQSNQWQSPLADFSFGLDAPSSIVVDATNTLYATDVDDETFLIRRFQDNQLIESYTFETPLNIQPILISQLNEGIIALTDAGDVFTVEGVGLSSLVTLNTSAAQIVAGTISPEGSITATTAQRGILSFDETGEVTNRIGRIVASFPLAGELVAPEGIAYSADGTLYWADSDGSFGAINAVNPTIESGRVGLATLALGTVREGELNDAQPEQTWTLDAQNNQTTRITLVADELSNLDVALRIIDPDGNEIAFADNDDNGILLNPLDVVLEDFRFSQSGIYSFIVERVTGDGRYTLGLTGVENLPFNAQTSERVVVIGQLQDALPANNWVFEVSANTTLTITMKAIDNTLDPFLRLYDSNGDLIAENDDADNPDLLRDAQLNAITLNSAGIYTIEASRFDGQGTYELTLEVVTAP